MYQLTKVGSFALTLALASSSLRAQGPPPGFQEVIVWGGLSGPTAVRFAPDGYVFVAEKSGIIKVFDDTNDPTPTVFADLRSQVYDIWDRGLLGLAIDPAFPVEPYIYVLYSHDYLGIESSCTDYTGNGCLVRGRVSRLEADVSAGPVMTGSELVLLEDWCQQFPSHSVGDLDFGFDGALYVTAGDGASFNYVDWGQAGNPCGDPPNEGGALRSQDLRTAGDPQTFDGTVLRIDPATGDALPDNPLFGGSVTDDDRIIAYGLRNPFRATIRPGTLELWTGDVGWSKWEELNVVRDPLDSVVENFGWPCYEGNEHQLGYDAANIPLCESLYAQGSSAVTPPYYAYQHSGGASTSGIAFYEGQQYPTEYAGALFYADYSAQWIWVMFEDASGEPDRGNRMAFRTGITAVDLQVGLDEKLYYVDLGANQVRRFDHFEGNQPPVAVAESDVTGGGSPLFVQFDGSNSFDPDQSGSLTYAWDLDGDGSFDDSTLEAPAWTYTETGSVTAKLRVTDGLGSSGEDSLVISVDNAPPVMTILAPSPNDSWRVGDLIQFEGVGNDPESGPLPAADLDWEVVLLHCDHENPKDCHVHSVVEFLGQSQGEFVAPDHEYPSHLEFRLTGTDSGPTDWWDPSWTVRQRLTLDNSVSSTELIDFPILVRLDSSRMDTARVQIDGSDLRFLSSDGSTLLAHQVESWDLSGNFVVWVRVPEVSAGSTTDSIWMYYGNPAATGAKDPNAVWSADYAGVWHLDTSFEDSTLNANHATNSGSQLVAGLLGEARSFDGIDDYIDCGSGASLAITSALTIEAWVRIDDSQLNAAMRVLSKKAFRNAPHGYNLEHHPFENTVSSLGSGGDFGRANGIDLDAGSWHYLVATHTGGQARIFIDGSDLTSDSTASPLIASSQALHIGRASGGGSNFLGDIDEVRISSIARSADWIAAQHRSMSDTFVTVGVPQELGRLSATTVIEVHPETAQLMFESHPTGIDLAVFGDTETTPFTREAIVNGATTISAPALVVKNGRRYEFVSWSDGGARSHSILVTENHPVLKATYRWSKPEIAR